MAIEKSVTNFLYEDIYTRFGVPQEIVIDRGEQFTSNAMKYLVEQYKIKHFKSYPYHPLENGKVESTNKVLEVSIPNVEDWNEIRR